ncbi:MAG TPA: cytochrome P450 [Acidimicrobiales bacterium]|nr:cytochrome P450 [Acidimicrobiales bacterium]
MSTSEASFSFETMLDPAFSRAPQPFYREMRDSTPVLRTELGLFGVDAAMVFLSRFEDIEWALRTPGVFSSAFGTGAEGLGNDRPLIPLQIDPPDHRRYRVLLDPLFAPREVSKLEADMVDLVNDLIDRFIERGECELNGEFAVPLPCTVFLKLLGLPMEDLDLFLRLKEGIIRAYGELDPEKAKQNRVAAGRECYEYFEKVLDEREEAPGDDLLSKLMAMEIEGERLSREEILDVCFLFMIAGLDTVTDSLTCFFAYLAQHPEHRQRLVDDPAVIPSAVEELLRWETPVPMVARVAKEDIEIRGCPVKKGDNVAVVLGSANTDERAIERSDEVDFDREDNRHYAFGGGIHRCLGSHLARVELRIALREWHRRIPEYHITDHVELNYAPLLRQVENLPVTFDRLAD